MKFKTILKNKIEPCFLTIFFNTYLFSHEKMKSSNVLFFLNRFL
ncbi:hypothetical protein LEP1GSC170_5394 [Leptospira interrogans serovar Bataviae str. HAI135]|nr:hypothetical protein LEP1GSC170_5394 [Leptospira interrogans serovar Bataviae str. HAI135]